MGLVVCFGSLWWWLRWLFSVVSVKVLSVMMVVIYGVWLRLMFVMIRLLSDELLVMLRLKVVMLKFDVMLVVFGVKWCVCLMMYICSFGMLLNVMVFYVSIVSIVSYFMWIVKVSVSSMIVSSRKICLSVFMGLMVFVSLLFYMLLIVIEML